MYDPLRSNYCDTDNSTFNLNYSLEIITYVIFKLIHNILLVGNDYR